MKLLHTIAVLVLGLCISQPAQAVDQFDMEGSKAPSSFAFNSMLPAGAYWQKLDNDWVVHSMGGSSWTARKPLVNTKQRVVYDFTYLCAISAEQLYEMVGVSIMMGGSSESLEATFSFVRNGETIYTAVGTLSDTEGKESTMPGMFYPLRSDPKAITHAMKADQLVMTYGTDRTIKISLTGAKKAIELSRDKCRGTAK